MNIVFELSSLRERRDQDQQGQALRAPAVLRRAPGPRLGRWGEGLLLPARGDPALALQPVTCWGPLLSTSLTWKPLRKPWGQVVGILWGKSCVVKGDLSRIKGTLRGVVRRPFYGRILIEGRVPVAAAGVFVGCTRGIVS